MTVLGGSARGLRMQGACALLTLFAVSACGSAPIPLIAVQGTTFVLMLPMYSGYGGDMPFWPLYNPADFLMFSLVFALLCFMGGLLSIVVRGLYALYKK